MKGLLVAAFAPFLLMSCLADMEGPFLSDFAPNSACGVCKLRDSGACTSTPCCGGPIRRWYECYISGLTGQSSCPPQCSSHNIVDADGAETGGFTCGNDFTTDATVLDTDAESLEECYNSRDSTSEDSTFGTQCRRFLRSIRTATCENCGVEQAERDEQSMTCNEAYNSCEENDLRCEQICGETAIPCTINEQKLV